MDTDRSRVDWCAGVNHLIVYNDDCWESHDLGLADEVRHSSVTVNDPFPRHVFQGLQVGLQEKGTKTTTAVAAAGALTFLERLYVIKSTPQYSPLSYLHHTSNPCENIPEIVYKTVNIVFDGIPHLRGVSHRDVHHLEIMSGIMRFIVRLRNQRGE